MVRSVHILELKQCLKDTNLLRDSWKPFINIQQTDMWMHGAPIQSMCMNWNVETRRQTICFWICFVSFSIYFSTNEHDAWIQHHAMVQVIYETRDETPPCCRYVLYVSTRMTSFDTNYIEDLTVAVFTGRPVVECFLLKRRLRVPCHMLALFLNCSCCFKRLG